MLSNNILEYYNYLNNLNKKSFKDYARIKKIIPHLEDLNIPFRYIYIHYLINDLDSDIFFNIAKLIEFNSNQITFLNRLNNNFNYNNFKKYYESYMLDNANYLYSGENKLFPGENNSFVIIENLFDNNTIRERDIQFKQTNFFNSSGSLFYQYKLDLKRSTKFLISKEYDKQNKIYYKILKINLLISSVEDINNLSLLLNHLDIIINIYLTLNKNYEYINNKNNNITKFTKQYKLFVEQYKDKTEFKEEEKVISDFKTIIKNIKKLEDIETINSMINEENIENQNNITMKFDEATEYKLKEIFDLIDITDENKINYSFDIKNAENISKLFSHEQHFLSNLMTKKQKCFTKSMFLKNFKIIYNIIKNYNDEELNFFMDELIMIFLFMVKLQQAVIADNLTRTFFSTDIHISQLNFCYYIYINNIDNFVDMNSKVIYHRTMNETGNKFDINTIFFNEQLNNYSPINMKLNRTSLIYKPYGELIKLRQYKRLLNDYNNLETFYPKRSLINLKTNYIGSKLVGYYLADNEIQNSISLNINNNKTLKKIKLSQNRQNNNITSNFPIIHTIDDNYELSPLSQDDEYLHPINDNSKTMLNISLKRNKYLQTTKLSNKVHRQRQRIKDNNRFVILANNIGVKNFLINNNIIEDIKYFNINGVRFTFEFGKYILEDDDKNKQFEYLYTNANAFINLYSLLKYIANYIIENNKKKLSFIDDYINDFFDKNIVVNEFLLLLLEFGKNESLFSNTEGMINYNYHRVKSNKSRAVLFGNISQIINSSKQNFYDDMQLIDTNNNDNFSGINNRGRIIDLNYLKLIIFSYFILFTKNKFIYKKLLLNFYNSIPRNDMNTYLSINLQLPKSGLITPKDISLIKINELQKYTEIKNEKYVLRDEYDFNILQNIIIIATNNEGTNFETNKKFMYLNKKQTSSRRSSTTSRRSSTTSRRSRNLPLQTSTGNLPQ